MPGHADFTHVPKPNGPPGSTSMHAEGELTVTRKHWPGAIDAEATVSPTSVNA